MRSTDDAPVALVTGANRGTGRAIAAELHRRGYQVVALNRTHLGEDWLHEIPCDLARPGAVAAGVAEALATFGRLDACVSNAAVRRLEPLAEMSTEAWTTSVAVNLTAAFELVRATLPAMRHRRGVYVIVGSHAGTHFFEGGAAYSATKRALTALVETLLLEERPYGVRATLVSPGAIANRAGDGAAHKMATDSVARCVGFLVQDQPADLVVGEIEVRPARLGAPDRPGIARLQRI